ncbi:MAG: hypothetical protein IK114_01765 [Fibrobacter sp.]|nr:hypothetical protein [Fibrobacter sp.]
MKLKLAFGIASAAMLFCACGDDTVTNITDEAKSKGTITLKVVDNSTGLAIDSAEVYSLIDAETEYTDSVGVTTWKKNAIGDYEYTIVKDGYATRTYTALLQENSQGDIARVEDRIEIVPMYKEGVSVKGTVLLKDPQNGNLSAAKNVKVVLSYDNSFIVPSEITTKTDTSGVYEFKNLAEGLAYSVKVPQVSVDDKTYASEERKAINSELRNGEQRVLEPVTMSIVGLTPELIKDNLQSLETDDNVKLSFSTALLADSVSTAWKVYKGAIEYYLDVDGLYYTDVYGSTEVLVTASLDDDDRTVVIKPVSEKWTKLATYTVVGTVYTNEGKSVRITKKFVPGGTVSRPDLIKGLVAEDYYGRYVALRWNKAETEVKGYKVFFQTSESADFEEYKAWGTGELPIDSTSCKKMKTASECDQYVDLGVPARTETNYYWYSKYEISSSDVRTDDDGVVYGDSTSYVYTWYAKYDTTEVSSIEDYTTSTYKYVWPDASICYASTYSYCPQYDEYGSDYTSRTYAYLSITGASPDVCKIGSGSSYTSCEQYELYGTSPKKTDYIYYKKIPTDSVSCTSSYDSYEYTLTPKCAEYVEEYGKYNSVNYNYWWYKKYASVKPTAESDRAFVSATSVIRSGTEWVKFIVLPYVIVDGDTVTADAVAATPSKFEVKKEKE